MNRTTKHRGRVWREVDLRADGWSIDGVKVLATSSERYIGVGSLAYGSVMLMTRSIHTFGMKKPISIAVLDLAGTVTHTSVVAQRRIVWFRALRWVIETRATAPLPALGMRIAASTIRDHARHTDPLRNTDREPWGPL